MRRNLEYLSESELNDLISLVENQELVAAPPDLKECVLGRIKEEKQSVMNKKEEFRRYCIRVWTSVAAAIVLIFAFPAVTESLQQYQTKESVLMKALGGRYIFDNGDMFHFFNDDGGK